MQGGLRPLFYTMSWDGTQASSCCALCNSICIINIEESYNNSCILVVKAYDYYMAGL
jgi:hypothetical protein